MAKKVKGFEDFNIEGEKEKDILRKNTIVKKKF